MSGTAQPDHDFSLESEQGGISSTNAAPHGARALNDLDLHAALQLLVERAQYVTGATGAALALLEGEEMVCRASTGRSAPAVGARLQVRSGLTGESIARRQLLRCDNAEADARVNLDACRELGIASIVVMPLLTRTGKARGLFELFSDHPYAFEERDLIALERMVELTKTALDFPAKPAGSSVATPQQFRVQVHAQPAESAEPQSATQLEPQQNAAGVPTLLPETLEPAVIAGQGQPSPPGTAETLVVPIVADEAPAAAPGAVPEAMRRIQKCTSCGFPVSEGRTLCLDCEKLDRGKLDRAKKEETPQELAPTESAEPVAPELLPKFLEDAVPPKESWLADHVNILAVIVLVLCILVAIVVFR